MIQSSPYFNIVTPTSIKQIFKFEKRKFSQRLTELLETNKVSSVRIKQLDLTPDELNEITDHIKKLNNNRVPILLEDNIELVLQYKLDGVHLTNGQKQVKSAKLVLSKDQVIGCFCGLSKHSGLVAAEQGANYIAFSADYNLVQNSSEAVELYRWWSEFIEIPLMGECSENGLIPFSIWNYSDFFSLRDSVWQIENSLERLFRPSEPKS